MGDIVDCDFISRELLNSADFKTSETYPRTPLEDKVQGLFDEGFTVSEMRDALNITHRELAVARRHLGFVKPRKPKRVRGKAQPSGKRAPFAVEPFEVPLGFPKELEAPKTEGRTLVGGVDPAIFTPEFRKAEIEAMVILSSTNYDMFVVQDQNRGLREIKEDSLFYQLMARDGVWKAYAIDCYRRADGFLVIRAGQHRYALAERLGLAILYIISSEHITISEIERSGRPWSAGNYLVSNIKNPEYGMLFNYMEQTQMFESQARKVLAKDGTNTPVKFAEGSFEVEKSGRTLEMIRVLADYFTALKASTKTSVRWAQLTEVLKVVSWLTLSGDVEMDRMLYKITKYGEGHWDNQARSFKEFAVLFEVVYNRGHAAGSSKYVYLDSIICRERDRRRREKRRKSQG